MPEGIRNIGASVRARLQNISRKTGQSFELILTRYALERLLYRLSTSAFSDRFVLKGAMVSNSIRTRYVSTRSGRSSSTADCGCARLRRSVVPVSP
jgi:predicted nucleotidyltransferase component of viral defense system